MSLPFGNIITRQRAEDAIGLICSLVIVMGVVCLILTATGTLVATACYVAGTVAAVAWLIAGALWWWYT